MRSPQVCREAWSAFCPIVPIIYAAITSRAKVVLGLLLAVVPTTPVFGRGYLRAVVFLPVYIFFNRQIAEGMTSGAVKG